MYSSSTGPSANVANMRSGDVPPSGSAPVVDSRNMHGLMAGARTENVAASSYTDSATSVPLYAPRSVQQQQQQQPIERVSQTTSTTNTLPISKSSTNPVPVQEVDHVDQPVAVLRDGEANNSPQTTTTVNEVRSGEYAIGDGRAYANNSTGVNTTSSPYPSADRAAVAENYRTKNAERPNEGSTLKTHIDSWSMKTLYGGPNTKDHYYTDSTNVSQFPTTRSAVPANSQAVNPAVHNNDQAFNKDHASHNSFVEKEEAERYK